MEGAVDSPIIKPINKGVIHRICSGHVILDLSSAVKELVENSLDAGASSIEISLKEYGEESFQVTDNGCGISPNNFKIVALKHHTSKIDDFSDLQSLTTFGFRGEALSSLCALGNLTVETRTKNEPVGTHLIFNYSGLVTSERKTARQIGTTVTVEKLFSTLPVRSKEFRRNIRREYGKLISLLNAYALISRGVRLVCSNTTAKIGKSVVLKTSGSSLKDNIIAVLGIKAFACLEPLELCVSDSCKVEGFLSKPENGSGRNLGDRQFFYVNGRPVDMPKVSKLINELYRSSNTRQYPIAIMNFTVPINSYDINVAPDKRKIFFSDEGVLMLSLREAIEKFYSSSHHSYSINKFDEPKKEAKVFGLDATYDEEDLLVSSKWVPTKESKQNGAVVSQKQGDDISIDMVGKDFQESSPGVVNRNEEDSLPKEDPLHSDSAEKSITFSAHQPKQLRTSYMSSKTADKHGMCHGRPVEKGHMKNMDLSCRPNFIQSSLTNIVSVSKRKHEDSGMVLSELPVLRSEMIPCQGSKTGSKMLAKVSRSLSTHGPGDGSTEVNKDELLEQGAIFHSPNEEEKRLSAEHDHDGREAEEEKVIPSADMVSRALTAPFQQPSDVGLDKTIPCSGSEICPILQFSMNSLRTRKSDKLSRSYASNSPSARKNFKRCYAAASLDNSQFEDVEGKAKALAAATTELEKLFRKEDFARMEVVGQFNLGFIIAKVDQDLFIVDQHAADEKYNFERLSQSTILNQQPLLQPMRLELSPEEEITASTHMEVIRKNGFTLIEDMHAPPGLRFLLKAVPFSKNMTFGAGDVKELISTLADSQGECSIISSYKMDDPSSICPSRVRNMLASRACRSSIMIGDALGKNEMQKILKHLAGLKSPWNCPHGRPTMRHLFDLSQLITAQTKLD